MESKSQILVECSGQNCTLLRLSYVISPNLQSSDQEGFIGIPFREKRKELGEPKVSEAAQPVSAIARS